MVSVAAEQNFTDRAKELKKLDVIEIVLASGTTKYIIPSGADIINVLGLDDTSGSNPIVPVRPRRQSENGG